MTTTTTHEQVTNMKYGVDTALLLINNDEHPAIANYLNDASNFFSVLDKTPSITIDLNDASFLSIVLDKWINENEITPTPHMNELLKKLQGKELC